MKRRRVITRTRAAVDVSGYHWISIPCWKSIPVYTFFHLFFASPFPGFTRAAHLLFMLQQGRTDTLRQGPRFVLQMAFVGLPVTSIFRRWRRVPKDVSFIFSCVLSFWSTGPHCVCTGLWDFLQSMDGWVGDLPDFAFWCVWYTMGGWMGWMNEKDGYKECILTWWPRKWWQ